MYSGRFFMQPDMSANTHFGHWVGNEQEAIAYYRKAFEIDSALETARDNLKLLGATLERQPFDLQPKPKN